jgi:hypothetical protein
MVDLGQELDLKLFLYVRLQRELKPGVCLDEAGQPMKCQTTTKIARPIRMPRKKCADGP